MKDFSVVERAIVNSLYSGKVNSNGWVRLNCPVCEERTGKDDKRAAFGFNVKTLFYSCFKCGFKGKLKESPDEIQTIEIRESHDPVAIGQPEGFIPLASEEGRTALSLEPARDYLMNRGIPQKLWKEANIGACAFGKYEGRIVVPVLGEQNEWLGWVGRIWVKKGHMPYLYPPGMSRGDILYNISALKENLDKPIMVVEGVFDVLALWPDAVAILGKPSHWQVQMLAQSKRPISVVLDGDAWQEGLALSLTLRTMGQRAGYVRLPPKKDPDEVDRTWLNNQVEESIDS